MTPARIRAIRENYQQRLESLLAVDEAIGQMVNQLAATGKLDNTYIIFTSDNGFMHGEHRIPQGKVVLYEPSIRVPLIMRGPGIPAGPAPLAVRREHRPRARRSSRRPARSRAASWTAAR